MKFRGPLDLAKVQGGYARTSEGFKLRRAERRSESQGPSNLHVISCIGDSQVEAPSCCNENCDIMIRDIPTSLRTIHQLGCMSEDLTKSEFGASEISETRCSCSLESRNAILWGHNRS
jgi:hypothetical protein